MREQVWMGVAAFSILLAVGGWVMWFRATRAKKACEAKTAKLEEEVQAARSLDEVTGAFNYPFFVKAANVQIKLARRHRWPVTLMVIDIDQLEKLNLRYSFKTGDRALKHLADSIASVVRSSDVLGRFGGSGIFVLLPECDTDNVRTVYDRIEEKIRKEPLTQGEKRIDYRHTGGAVTMYGMHIHLNRMLGLAEDALNVAKERQTDLVIFDKEGMEVKRMEIG